MFSVTDLSYCCYCLEFCGLQTIMQHSLLKLQYSKIYRQVVNNKLAANVSDNANVDDYLFKTVSSAVTVNDFDQDLYLYINQSKANTTLYYFRSIQGALYTLCILILFCIMKSLWRQKKVPLYIYMVTRRVGTA